jgi:dihydroorotate dehydrogenase electron transfer subunit
MRTCLDAPVLAHEQLAEFEYQITLQAPAIAQSAKPGQFVQVLYDNSYNPFTRRPFSVYTADPSAGTISIVYLARGIFTQGLRGKRAGELVSLVGPLGNWFQPASPSTLHILVAGGVGAPPLYFFAETLHRSLPPHPVLVINGARTAGMLTANREFAALGVPLQITTNDGSLGRRGIVTDALRPALESLSGPAQVYTCGPTPMMRAVAEMSESFGVPCHVSLETVMPCGVGVCMGCVVRIVDETSESGFQHLRSCWEGPVFDSRRVIWDE